MFLTIDGEMGLLVAFGDDANFVVSVGGFHPRFNPPPLPFPSPRRIAVSILNTPVSRIRVEGYFAVTSNTVQFGARVEVFFGLDVAQRPGPPRVRRAVPVLAVLLHHRDLGLAVGEGLRRRAVLGRASADRSTVRRRGTSKGHGSISLLFWDIDVDFDETWGEAATRSCRRSRSCRSSQASWTRPTTGARCCRPAQRCSSRCARCRRREAALMLHPVGALQHLAARGAARHQARQGRRAEAERRQPALDRRSPAAAWRRRTTPSRGSRRRSSRISPTPRSCRKPAFAPERSGLDSRPRRRPALQRDGAARRALRRDHHRHQLQALRRAASACYIGVLFNFFANGGAPVTQVRAVAGREDEASAVRREDRRGRRNLHGRRSGEQQGRSPPTPASFHSEASAREFLEPQVAADPSLADAMHVIPQLRDGRMSDARHLLVPALAAAGPGEPDHVGRLRQRASRSAPHVDVHARRRAATSSGGGTAGGAGRPAGRAVRPRRHRRHRPARHRAHRAARLDHELRAELPRRTSSSTTRTFPGATRRPRRTGQGTAAAVAHAGRA